MTDIKVAPVVAEDVELDFIGTGTHKIEIVEILAVRRYRCRVGYAMRVLPAGRPQERGTRAAPFG
jgi:hypothetical protein